MKVIFLVLMASLQVGRTTAFTVKQSQQKRRQEHTGSSIYSKQSTTTTTTTTQLEERTAVNVLDAAEEEKFLQKCKELCNERNLKLDSVKNARDLASVKNSPVQPGRIFRMGRVSDASENDIELLFNTLQLRTLVDLRSPTELKDDPTLLRDEVFQNFTSIVWKEKGRNKDGCLVELESGKEPFRRRFWDKTSNHHDELISPSHPVVYPDINNDDDIDEELHEELETDDEIDEYCDLDCDEEDDEENKKLNEPVSKPSRKERHFVSLMNEFKYVKGTVSKLRKRDITKAILKSPGAMFSKRMRASLKKPFLDEINDGGLPMLNELLLRFGSPGIKYVLELCADTTRHPVGFYCTAGKDRTGIIAAIILGLCGCKEEDIVEDYTLSANVYAEMNDHKAMVGALSQRNLDPKTFLGAPASVMKDTLKAINEEYGSVEGYCDWIGFDREQQEKLRKALME